MLANKDFEKPFLVEANASSTAMGAVLSQTGEARLFHPVQYASHTLKVAERKYSVWEREALAIVFGLRKFCVYLLSTQPFLLYTDQKALKSAFAK